MKKVHTDKAPNPVAPYSQAIITGNLIFTAGQIGLDSQTNELVGNDISAQTNQAIKNIKAILEETGSSLDEVVKTTCYLTSMSNYQTFNEIYAKFFTEKPARATIEVSKLPKDALVEIEAIAEVML